MTRETKIGGCNKEKEKEQAPQVQMGIKREAGAGRQEGGEEEEKCRVKKKRTAAAASVFIPKQVEHFINANPGRRTRLATCNNLKKLF